MRYFLAPVVAALAACCADAPAAAPTPLRAAAPATLLIGTAADPHHLADPAVAALIATHFNALTPENAFKPAALQPKPGQFTFAAADQLADFAARHRLALIGHALCWHEQSPRWMYEDAAGKPLARDAALANLRTHIVTVAAHFRGKVRGWDVVNEALAEPVPDLRPAADKGPADLRDTPARRAIGDDYLAHAFRFAREADPAAELYYNDFNIELPVKRARAVRLLRTLKAAGVRVDAVGIQAHWHLDHPALADIDAAITAFKAEGVKVMLTELDIDVLPTHTPGADLQATRGHGPDPYRDACPPAVLAAQAKRYADIFTLVNKHTDTVTRVTLWGTHDAHSWLNNYPVRNRTNHPLLFDRKLKPKPAFDAVLNALRTPDPQPRSCERE